MPQYAVIVVDLLLVFKPLAEQVKLAGLGPGPYRATVRLFCWNGGQFFLERLQCHRKVRVVKEILDKAKNAAGFLVDVSGRHLGPQIQDFFVLGHHIEKLCRKSLYLEECRVTGVHVVCVLWHLRFHVALSDGLLGYTVVDVLWRRHVQRLLVYLLQPLVEIRESITAVLALV